MFEDYPFILLINRIRNDIGENTVLPLIKKEIFSTYYLFKKRLENISLN